MKNRFLYFLIVVVAVSRLIPHPMNVTPVGALGLFSGAYIRDARAYAIPVIALVIGDVFIGFYPVVVMVAVYAGFAASVGIGRLILRVSRTPLRLGLAACCSAIVFFLISNFGAWYHGYPHTLEGLALCYFNGLPFLGRTLVGNLLYTALMFGTCEAMLKYVPETRRA